MTYLYWHHSQTGEIFAVRVDPAGLIDGAVGPIPLEEATAENLRQWPFDQKKGEQLRRRVLGFERVRS